MAEKDKKFWMDTLSDFLNQEDLFVDPNEVKDTGKYEDYNFLLSSGEWGIVDGINTVGEIFELFETQFELSYIRDLADEAKLYGLKLPEAVRGYEPDQWEYWVELRNAYEAGELQLEGDAKEYFENHEYEFDVVELVTRHFEDFTIAEWLESNTHYHTYRVGCFWQMYGHIEVRARNMEEAQKAVKKLAATCPLPDDGEYLDDSFELDEENIEEAD